MSNPQQNTLRKSIIVRLLYYAIPSPASSVNIVILHCHFERGGVTQVVENHVRSLRDAAEVDRIVLVSGNRVSGLSSETLDVITPLVVDDFDYDSDRSALDSVENRSVKIAGDLRRQLAALGLSSENTILHWHNHSLGKNTAAPAVIANLAIDGWRILLQIHDFAEDNRPDNYRKLIEATAVAIRSDLDRFLYPVASQIQYATLTRGDAEVLRRLGIPQDQTHCLPNSVLAASNERPNQEVSLARVREAMGLPSDATWSLYPVRGIRRKNVGEFLMLCRWMPDGMYGGLTLCPTTPVENRSYERWRQVASTLAPSAVFDAAHHPGVTFADNLAASEFVVSTSVAEGFGMAFMEPWLSDRGVIARRLPTVTDDFESAGVRLPDLYDEIPIVGDASWIRERQLELIAETESAWAKVPIEFRPTLHSSESETDAIDFAKLTPRQQIRVLGRLESDSGLEAEVKARSGELVSWLHQDGNDDEIRLANATTIRDQFSPQRMGWQLLSIYRQLDAAVCDDETRGPAHAGSAVDWIASARPFYPCRTEVIDD